VLQHVPCPLCGAHERARLYPATPSFDPTLACYSCTSPQLASHGEIVRCRSCGMVFADPQPDAESLTLAYREVQDPLYLQGTSGREATFATTLMRLEALRQPPGELLDVGCYTGVFLRVAATHGWSVTGLELSRWAAAQARATGVGPVHETELADAPLAPTSLDVITMWDVIEHVRAPRLLLDAARRLLRPGGLLALSTHTLDSPIARLLGRRYPFLMGMHLCHFTRPTLRRLLTDRGFELALVATHERAVQLRYVMERASHLLGLLRPLLDRFGSTPFATSRLVRIRWLGLVEAYAIRR
jgi:SAM-dependent methyltransferase